MPETTGSAMDIELREKEEEGQAPTGRAGSPCSLWQNSLIFLDRNCGPGRSRRVRNERVKLNINKNKAGQVVLLWF